ncbi:unnamed protein product [Adineta ricciae]|uniref:NAD(+)--protein-arginine ADP-ribosyltransferase n=1 Tax=Adineta ricciae TaxID=249248 RepID=A0A816D3G1_ADIRI|nr:unnamed protein product [Adineta ricciae]CAF1630424.1 unnamed protein product [Adineta ricciae]
MSILCQSISNADLFYEACRHNNIKLVRQLLPKLSYKEFIRQDMYGNTVLHIACENNYFDLVQLLLQSNFGQNPHSQSILNYIGQIPCQCAFSSNIRSLFPESSSMKNHFISIDNVSLSNNEFEWIHLYENATDALDARFLMSITRSSWFIKRLLRFLMEKEAVNIVESLLKHYITKESEYKKAKEIFEEYIKTKNPKHLLTIYTMNTPLYNALHKENNAFSTLLYLHLDRLKQWSLSKCELYRGVTKDNFDDYQKILRDYKKAKENTNHIIEICALQSTSLSKEVAKCFADSINPESYAILFYFKFPNECPTAIRINEFSNFRGENEVLLLPFTLFKIKDIKEDSPKYLIISLENVPVPPATFNVIWRQIQI